MSENVLQAEIREGTGKELAKKLRRQGKIPGVFYGHDENPISIVLDERNALKILTSESGLIDFQIGKKKKRKVIIKEVQTDPVRQSLVHIDVMGVRLEEKITISVAVHVIGESIGVKEQGGILHQYLREVEVSCLPLNIPDHIEVDVSNMKVGDAITLGTLAIENVEFLGDLDQPIVNVMLPAVVKEKVEEEAPQVEEGAAEKESAEESKK
jgi:large subunit ribosomal protein L25